MNPIHPDWKDDSKLWNALGNLPKQAPSSNFSHMVHQKIADSSSRKSRIWNALQQHLFPTPQIKRGWIAGLSLATVCLTLTLILPFSRFSGSSNPRNTILFTETQTEVDAVESIVMNPDFLNDLDVILHLDELEAL